MGSSAKKKKEKKKDFQKPKLKVGKARPKNTNATDTSFSAKSIVFKQQNLNEVARDDAALFNHNLSLLSSKSDTQRRDALAYLTSVCNAQKTLPQSTAVILLKAQPLMLDGSSQVRQQFLKLLRALSPDQLGSLDQLLLYTRAGMAHLSTEIRMTSLDVLDWLIQTSGEVVLASAGGWVKTLRTFQTLLSWRDNSSTANTTNKVVGDGGIKRDWSSSNPATNLGSNKLLVHQLSSLASFLSAGLEPPSARELREERASFAQRAAETLPCWHTDAHVLSQASNPFGYLNLFGVPRDTESEMYEDSKVRSEVFRDLYLDITFGHGAQEARKEGGEVGRAAASVVKALRLVDAG